MKIQEIISEAVSDNLLYHSVHSGDVVSKIFKSGAIKVQPAHELDCDDPEDLEMCPPVISFSRDQYYRFGDGIAQFVVDKSALRNAGYKVKPLVGRGFYKAEAEERVFKDIPLRLPFVVAVQFDPKVKVPPSISKQLKELGIKLIPWRPARDDQSSPEYDLNKYDNDMTTDEPEFDSHVDTYNAVKNLIKAGIEPLPDWKRIQINKGPGWSTIYYKIDGWTAGFSIAPFEFINPAKAEEISRELQQLTKSGQSILPVIKKYSKVQTGKSWKQGKHQIRPGEPGYVEPDSI
jgi:hypothetical protein